MTSIGLEGLGGWEAGKIGAERWAGRLRGWEIRKSKVLGDLPREGTHRGGLCAGRGVGLGDWEAGHWEIEGLERSHRGRLPSGGLCAGMGVGLGD